MRLGNRKKCAKEPGEDFFKDGLVTYFGGHVKAVSFVSNMGSYLSRTFFQKFGWWRIRMSVWIIFHSLYTASLLKFSQFGSRRGKEALFATVGIMYLH